MGIDNLIINKCNLPLSFILITQVIFNKKIDNSVNQSLDIDNVKPKLIIDLVSESKDVEKVNFNNFSNIAKSRQNTQTYTKINVNQRIVVLNKKDGINKENVLSIKERGKIRIQKRKHQVRKLFNNEIHTSQIDWLNEESTLFNSEQGLKAERLIN